ncbi:MAG TPA: hypothetical protein PKG98_00545 [Myxococcota bacterium]|nr:hypothetical protein [Myxococcota bacterium]
MSRLFNPIKVPAVFGATGSLGRCVCRQIALNGLRCAHLAAMTSHDGLAGLIAELRPRSTSFKGSPSTALSLAMSKADCIREQSIAGALAGCDGAIVVSSGLDGVGPIAQAARLGIPVAAGNKEALVACGKYLKSLIRKDDDGSAIRPVDSEHSAAAVLIRQAGGIGNVSRLVLTGTGGAVRAVPHELRSGLTPGEVLRHPVWKMGPKITVDSATLMNKAFEIVEAAVLFDMPVSRISVMFDPTANVHAAIETSSGVLAYRAPADMAIPVRIALGMDHGDEDHVLTDDEAGEALDSLLVPDQLAMRPIALGRAVVEAGGCMPMVLAVADEAAVSAFLRGMIGFGDIVPLLEDALERFHAFSSLDPLDPAVLEHVRAEVEDFFQPA